MLRIAILAVGLAFAVSTASAVSLTSYSTAPSSPQVALKVVTVQGKKLIAPSAAARIAQRVSPRSKLLNVRLSGGRPPRYVIKARNKGRLQIIVINAKTGSVMRR